MKLHKHDWRLYGSQRLDFSGSYYGDKVFMVTVYSCSACGEFKASASDMQPYLDMKLISIGPDGVTITESDDNSDSE